jgi:ribosome maturation factor RimP
MRQGIEAKAWEVCEPLIAAEGLELLDIEYLREHDWVLRLTIDKPGSQVGIDECSRASHAVDKALDVEDFIPNEYSLEVSSPGLDRPLKRLAHYLRVIGKTVRVKTFAPLFDPPRKNFIGILKEATEDSVVIEVEGEPAFVVPMTDIAKANLEFELTKPEKPGKPAKKPGQKPKQT